MERPRPSSATAEPALETALLTGAIEKRTPPSGTARVDLSWRRLYSIGGYAALLFVVLVLVPIVLVFVAPLPPSQGRPLLEYIAEHKAVYLVELVSFVGLAVPALLVFAALGVALSTVNKTLALIGGLLGIVSETIALALGSSPQSLHGGMVVLSDAYAGADQGEQAALVAAAEALIAATNAVSWAGILTAGAILVLSVVMWQGQWGRALSVVGMAAGAIGVLSEALRPMIGSAYLVYGLLLPIWFAWVGVKLFRVGGLSDGHPQAWGERPIASAHTRPRTADVVRGRGE
ncbi:hypothetical protein [Tessaracoccus sp. MC1756]|uniref:hypothetical protein n=1 Tax=Tessaracoccus sp. MC1756 TaxID=2760311 RepID=UPI001600B575|nr:hypothetical protein [Tessaracoccus sp. MC1756]MBB1509247.1 hypothetical protein [Tessaracoccus sp. MC1756]